MTTDSTTAATVYSYDTADTLEGVASPELVAESLSREGQGGVCAAYLEDGVWRYVPDSEVDFYRIHRGETVVTVYVLADDEDEPEPTIEADVDSLHVVEDEETGRTPAAGALSYYVMVDVTVDGKRVRVGCMVGAEDYQHGTVRASGAGVRPFCSAWWADVSDHQDVPAGAREAVLEALVDASWALFQRADDLAEVEADEGDDLIDEDGDCRECGHPADGSSGHGTCDSPAHQR